MITKALSIRQPWASVMAIGAKRIENRNWSTRFRGRVLIHASKWWNGREVMEDRDFVVDVMRDMPIHAPEMDHIKTMRGGIIGAFTVIGCVDQSDDPFFFGPYGFVVEDAIAFPEVVPCQGRLGFFDVEPTIAQRCHEQLTQPGEKM